MAESECIREDNVQFTTFRDGIIFVIDATPKMFKIDPDTNETYFALCLKLYGNILGKKLSWNRRDWIGLMLFGTDSWDRIPTETEHIKTLQELDEITVYMLSATMDLYSNKIEHYSKLASATEYPLHDVLWLAGRAFDSVKVAMQQRRVILLTRRDNPFADNEEERHRIRLRAKSFGDMNVNLQVVGLGDDWNHDLFYKDIEMLANKTGIEDTKPTKLVDVEVDVKFPSRVTAHLKWKIGNGVELRTVVTSFSSLTQNLKKVVMSNTTNEILERHGHWGAAHQEFDRESSENESEDPESEVPVAIKTSTNLLKGVEFGGKKIAFFPEEVKNIRVHQKSGIELLGFKPIVQNWIHHIKPAKLVGVDPDGTTAEKELFAALLTKCEEKRVMATCVMGHQAAPYLANLTPCSHHNGFYVNKIAFTEQINCLDSYTEPYVYVGGGEDGGDLPLPTDAAGVALLKKIIKKTTVKWNPYMFQSPKLRSQLEYIETLALDSEAIEQVDKTLPPRDIMVRSLGSLPEQFKNMFADSDCHLLDPNEECAESAKRVKYDVAEIRSLCESGNLQYKLHKDLRAMAQSLGVSGTGKKEHIVQRIREYLRKH